jgi:FemAB-related protein (PEP-CTERM system-associated)
MTSYLTAMPSPPGPEATATKLTQSLLPSTGSRAMSFLDSENGTGHAAGTATAPPGKVTVTTHDRGGLIGLLPRLGHYAAARGGMWPLSSDPSWALVLEAGLGHTPYVLTAEERGEIRGYLSLSFMRSALFGRFLVSLPYLNYGGVQADNDATACLLIDHAVALADRLDVRYLEIRHVRPLDHPALVQRPCNKVHMSLPLPATVSELWDQIPSKVRNQVRKGHKIGLRVVWGDEELLPEFYSVFSHNMRDLGTPVYGTALFRSVLRHYPGRAEVCCVRHGDLPAAAGLLIHGVGVTEVPSASSLRRFNHLCPNMLMYWSLLERAVQRGQSSFDFGRSSPDSPTYQFKKQWGATPSQSSWQYYVRSGRETDMRPDNPRYQRMIRLWQRLPVVLTRWIGPSIVRGIP